MTEGTDALPDNAPHGALEAGALLRAGREAAGLSIAAVAQQLKLAPRQIAALEEGDYTKLPGRTFIRGFMRNYARLLRLDSDTVLAALPDAVAAPAHEHPSLAATPRPMGELPADANARPSPARWAIPLALVAVVTVAAVYEMTRPQSEPARPVVVDKPAAPPQQAAPGAESGTASAPRTITNETNGGTSTALPNPVASLDDKDGAASESATRGVNAAEAQGGSSLQPAAADASLALTFQGTSWVEVRDGAGVLILSVTGSAGNTQAVSGRPPLDVVLGNAAVVTVSWQGKTFDTTPFTRQNVAKFTLK